MKRTVHSTSYHPLLPFPAACERTAEQLAARLGAPVEVRWGRSVSLPVQATRTGPAHAPDHWRLRLHRAFAGAPDAVVEDLGAWLRSGRRARTAATRLDRWIEARIAPLARARPMQPEGAAWDLEPLAAEVLAGPLRGSFAARTPPPVGWGRHRRSSARHSLRLGSYDPRTHRVRVHPVLDSGAVPRWFLSFLLFHEFLHVLVPPEPGPGGRAVNHGPDFRTRERQHPDHDKVRGWERTHLPALLRAARNGHALGVSGTTPLQGKQRKERR